MSFFAGVPEADVRAVTGVGDGDALNYTLTALRWPQSQRREQGSRRGEQRDVGHYAGHLPIIPITNSQNGSYWRDPALAAARKANDDAALLARKRELKQDLFKIVADQTGNVFNPDTLTIVWARRFAAYKRADLIVRDLARFERIVRDTKRPVQVIWAGKPYPLDYGAIAIFNRLIQLSKNMPNCAVLTGYELGLSAAMKKGSDIWLNTPIFPREASGTSGMTAAMNGSVN